MRVSQELKELKERIRSVIARNSDRGFLPYGACMRVCSELEAITAIAEQYANDGDYQQAFDIYIMVLVQTVRLLSHADDSSGCCGDVIGWSLEAVDKICRDVSQSSDDKYYFETLLKTAKNKAFKGWLEWPYELIKSAAYFVRNDKEAQKVYALFPILSDNETEYEKTDQMLIIHRITERLEGEEAAERYLLSNAHLPELRMLAVEKALARQNYELVEQLCRDAIARKMRGDFNRRAPWPYYLEQMYCQTNNTEKLLEIIRYILFTGDTMYFDKLKEMCRQRGQWETDRERLWEELPKKIGLTNCIDLFAREGENERLLSVVREHPSYLEHYGKQLAMAYPDEVYSIFEKYILKEAKQATCRRNYKGVCGLIKKMAKAGGGKEALNLIEHLSQTYPRRPAMLEELTGLKRKLER